MLKLRKLIRLMFLQGVIEKSDTKVLYSYWRRLSQEQNIKEVIKKEDLCVDLQVFYIIQ